MFVASGGMLGKYRFVYLIFLRLLRSFCESYSPVTTSVDSLVWRNWSKRDMTMIFGVAQSGSFFKDARFRNTHNLMFYCLEKCKKQPFLLHWTSWANAISLIPAFLPSLLAPSGMCFVKVICLRKWFVARKG